MADDGSLALLGRLDHPRPFHRRSLHVLEGRLLVTTTDDGRVYAVALPAAR